MALVRAQVPPTPKHPPARLMPAEKVDVETGFRLMYEVPD